MPTERHYRVGFERGRPRRFRLLLAALRLRPEGLAFQNLPEAVRALAELYEINDWIKS